jgi:hypothetical protein
MDRYPSDEYLISEETDRNRIARILESKASCCWGQGPIPGTDYYMLFMLSKEHKGGKRTVCVCKQSRI